MGTLQGGAAFKENALLGAFAHAHHNGGGGCQPQGARTGNNQHGYQPDQRIVKSGSTGQPDNEGKNGNDNNYGHKNR